MPKFITYQTVCDTCRHRSVTAGALPCRTCEGYSSWEKPAPTEADHLRSTLAAHCLSAGTQIWRQQREASILTDVARQQAAELVRYSLALAPILRHADGPDLSPPLRLSIQETRRMTGEVGNDAILAANKNGT